MADDKQAAKKKLDDLLMTMDGHRRHLEDYRKKEDVAGMERCKLALKLDHSRIRSHCAEHDLDLPHDVPDEDSK